MFEEVERLFTTELQKAVEEYGGSYIDAIVGLCDQYDLEPAFAAKYLFVSALYSPVAIFAAYLES